MCFHYEKSKQIFIRNERSSRRKKITFRENSKQEQLTACLIIITDESRRQKKKISQVEKSASKILQDRISDLV